MKGRYIMNNEFEKNPEMNNNDNTSEFSNNEINKSEVTEASAIEESAENTVVEENCKQENVCEPLSAETDSAPSEYPHAEADKDITSHSANSEYSYYEEKKYIQNGDAYVYSKTADDNSGVVGCVWDNTNESGTQKKKKSGVNGFKVFTAAMLGVFTLSSITIAGFLAADYIKDQKSNSSPTPSSNNSSYTSAQNQIAYPSQSGQTTMISTFLKAEGKLTKSQVAAKCSPSTVGIVVAREQNYSGYSYSIPFFGDFGIPGGTQIIQGSGSGFVFSADGYIITNHHVVNGATKITVHFNDGSTAEAELIGSDALSDIAVIKIDATDKTLIPMEIGDSNLMQVGDEVLAIGCPAGIELMGTVTDGIISAINRDVELDNDSSKSASTKTMTLLQTNATINRGNSGGPLINTSGQVIGINTLKLSADYEGIGFSIPMSGALPIINQLIEHGEVVERTESFVSSEGVIGISASAITKDDSEYYDIPIGLMVVQIDKDSSAAAAGLRRGDIITKFNGEEVTTVNQLNKLKAKFKAGDEVTVSVYRDTVETPEEFDITFKLDMAD